MLTELTDTIFDLTAPYDNPFQGKDEKLLFVCSAGILRSATAANLFAKRGYNTRSCGTHDYALIPLSVNLIYWADKIFFMTGENHTAAEYLFYIYPEVKALLQKKSEVLNIPDIYEYNHPDLIALLEKQIDL